MAFAEEVVDKRENDW